MRNGHFLFWLAQPFPDVLRSLQKKKTTHTHKKHNLSRCRPTSQRRFSFLETHRFGAEGSRGVGRGGPVRSSGAAGYRTILSFGIGGSGGQWAARSRWHSPPLGWHRVTPEKKRRWSRGGNSSKEGVGVDSKSHGSWGRLFLERWELDSDWGSVQACKLIIQRENGVFFLKNIYIFSPFF